MFKSFKASKASKTLQDWLSWQETLHPSEIDLGLDRVAQVLHRLLPDSVRTDISQSDASLSERADFALPYTIITIAGTNGKGSTVAMLEAVFTEAGYRVGSYTSPHLLRYNERIKIDQKPVADDLLCDSFTRIDQARDELSITYFEFGTLAAIDIFYRQSCELVILEVGLGGRLDAVNVLDPDIALVTTVDIDHQQWLGSDRDSIGIEKAGIYRTNKPAIYGDSDCPQSILDIVKQQKLCFYQYSVDYQYQSRAAQWDWLISDNTVYNKAPLQSRYNLPLPNLKGSVQLKNAANVLMVLELLKNTCPVTQAEIKRGLSAVQLPGRFQIISMQPMIILDVAHNVQAATILRQSIEQLPAATGKLHVIVGMLKDKDVLAVLRVLAPLVDSWRIIELDTPRAMPAAEIEALLKNKIPFVEGMGHKAEGIGQKAQCFANFEQAYKDFSANKLMFNPMDKLLVFGSFYTVTDALNFLPHLKTKATSE